MFRILRPGAFSVESNPKTIRWRFRDKQHSLRRFLIKHSFRFRILAIQWLSSDDPSLDLVKGGLSPESLNVVFEHFGYTRKRDPGGVPVATVSAFGILGGGGLIGASEIGS